MLRGFGVSGGENGVYSRRLSIGGDRGVFGSGFSRIISLLLRACLLPRRGGSRGAVAGTPSEIDADLSPMWIFVGLLCAPEIEPSFLIPLRTPEKKSLLSGDASSSVEESEVENLDSSEPGGRRVSLSDMIDHAGEA